MSKHPRGLPDNFQIDVPEKLGAPVVLDEFIDDELARARTVQRKKEEQVQEPPPAAAAAPSPVAPPEPLPRPTASVAPESRARVPQRPPQRAVRPAEPAPAPLLRPRFRQAGLPPSKPLRVQLNMSPAVNKMLGDLVEHFRTYCVQKDTTPSEIFEALVGALHDARGQLGLGNVPPRGQWGSASAHAFRTHIRNAITEAIVSQYEASRELAPPQ